MIVRGAALTLLGKTDFSFHAARRVNQQQCAAAYDVPLPSLVDGRFH